MSANISVLGNLGRSPETHFSPEGTFIANFSIASHFVRNTPQGNVKETNWYRVTAIGKQAESLAAHARKGDRLHIQGKLNFSPWLDREGCPQVSADLLLQDFQFVGGNESEVDLDQIAKNEPEHVVETEFSADIQEIADQTLSY